MSPPPVSLSFPTGADWDIGVWDPDMAREVMEEVRPINITSFENLTMKVEPQHGKHNTLMVGPIHSEVNPYTYNKS